MSSLSRRKLLASLPPAAGAAISSLSASSSIETGVSSQTVNTINAAALSFLEQIETPGMSLSVTLHGENLIENGYGLANIEHQVPASKETVFQMGSIGKMFAAALALILRRDGMLDIDAPLTDIIPDAPQTFQTVTARQLLNHTSGLAPYEDKLDLRKDYTDGALLDEIYGLGFVSKPAEKFAYSNTAYVLLGILLTRAGDIFYGDQLAKRLFHPAGMMNTRIISEIDIIPHRAAGYEIEMGEIKNQAWVSPTFLSTADGAIYTTAADMQKWGLALRDNTILNRSEYEVLTTPTLQSIAAEFPYGMGMIVSTIAGKTVHHHTGSWQGFRAGFMRIPEDDLIISINGNSNTFPAERALRTIAGLFIPELSHDAETAQ